MCIQRPYNLVSSELGKDPRESSGWGSWGARGKIGTQVEMVRWRWTSGVVTGRIAAKEDLGKIMEG